VQVAPTGLAQAELQTQVLAEAVEQLSQVAVRHSTEVPVVLVL